MSTAFITGRPGPGGGGGSEMVWKRYELTEAPFTRAPDIPVARILAIPAADISGNGMIIAITDANFALEAVYTIYKANGVYTQNYQSYGTIGILNVSDSGSSLTIRYGYDYNDDNPVYGYVACYDLPEEV